MAVKSFSEETPKISHIALTSLVPPRESQTLVHIIAAEFAADNLRIAAAVFELFELSFYDGDIPGQVTLGEGLDFFKLLLRSELIFGAGL